jgi:molybdenum transport protein
MFLISDSELQKWLAEDVPYGDLTTHALAFGQRRGRISFKTRQAMIAACSEEAARLVEIAGAKVTECVPSGTNLQSGDLILTAEGPACALHTGWKVSQTLLETAGGIAASAKAIVEAARGGNPNVVVACTRKSIPGTRALAIKAILSGGAVPHRLGLSETVLVFAQHRVFLEGETLGDIVKRLRAHLPEKKIVVEAETLAEAILTANAGVDVVQLDKATPNDVASLRRHCNTLMPRPLIAAAGGINATNSADYARAGADVIVTSAPYTARPVDVKVVMVANVC